ncbi:uncharacterized mitochondrial protein AtMg00810-like [Capsicum annuum]|uniref:uncharacterized mitochondrial protein AtMg00810-like n=1 Tax=Capsicum annuum TaxID=4072 RepID=UPI001FB0DABA|nr:uncharacterized mitochondrial protein AtMg00810-like [Capsicum annuum]
MKWSLYQFDAKSEFLNGELEEEVYFAQLQGFEISGQEEKVYQLRKALYGFEMTDLGLLHYFLGLEVKQGEGDVFFSQKKYALDLLKRFGLVNCKFAATPMNMNEKLQQEDGTGFMRNPLKHHFGAAKRILHYIIGTLEHGIWYSYVSNFRLVRYTDSDWRGSVDDRKSTSGNTFSLGSGAITWSSKKQATTTMLTLEAEYIAATSSACQCIWLRRILFDL